MLWNNALRHAYANGGRHILHAAISEDEGRTWRGYREIARDPRRNEPPPPTGDHGVSYTIPVLTKEKKIIVPMPIESDRGYLLLHLDPE